MKLKIYIICLLITINLYACAERNNDLSCEALVPKTSFEDINTTLGLRVPSHVNSFDLSDAIILKVDNNSNAIIEAAPDRDLKIFWWKENSWEPIKNGVDYLSAIDYLSPRTSDDPGGTIYDVELNIPEQHDSVRVCIILEGIKDPEGSRSKVVAFIEVVLNP